MLPRNKVQIIIPTSVAPLPLSSLSSPGGRRETDPETDPEDSLRIRSPEDSLRIRSPPEDSLRIRSPPEETEESRRIMAQSRLAGDPRRDTNTGTPFGDPPAREEML